MLDLRGCDAGQQRKIAGDHEALNVMGIGVATRRVDGFEQAMHVRLRGPVEIRQRPGRIQIIALRVVRHVQPVQTADVLAPSQYLPDEALDRVQRRPVTSVGLERRLADFARQQQADVQVRRQHRVEQVVFGCLHCILVVAEQGQAVVDEMLQRRQRVLACGAPAERGQVAKVALKMPLDQCEDIAGVEIVRQCPAVVRVIIPLAALGLLAIHEPACVAAHLTVEVFHAQAFAAVGPRGELVP